MQTTQITIEEPTKTVKPQSSKQEKSKRKQTGKSGELLDKIKSAGYKVYVKHERETTAGRFTVNRRPAGSEVLPRGGSTHITIENGLKSFKGVAYCNPVDNYNNNLGRFKALGKALMAMKYTDPTVYNEICEILNTKTN